MEAFAYSCFDSSRSHACGERSDHREADSAQQSCAESDMDDISLPRHRPRRNAKARREQMRRSYTRMVTRLIKGLTSIREHRGNSLSIAGSELLQTLQPSSSENRINVCRHWRAGRCTYGSSCRFAHQDDVDGHAHTDPDSDIEAGQSNYVRDVEASVHDNSRHYACRNFGESYNATVGQVGTGRPAHGGVVTGDQLEHVLNQCEANADGYRYDRSDHDYSDHDYGIGDYLDHCKRTRLLLEEFRAAADHYHKVHNTDVDTKTDERNGTNETGDDIEDIINVLRVLEGADLHHALAALPPHLLEEVQDRLSHIVCKGQAPRGNSEVPHENIEDFETLAHLSQQSDSLDETLIALSRQLLRVHNGNKKVVRSLVGAAALACSLRAPGGNNNGQDLGAADVTCVKASHEAIHNLTVASDGSKCDRLNIARPDSNKTPCRYLQRNRERSESKRLKQSPPKYSGL